MALHQSGGSLFRNPMVTLIFDIHAQNLDFGHPKNLYIKAPNQYNSVKKSGKYSQVGRVSQFWILMVALSVHRFWIQNYIPQALP